MLPVVCRLGLVRRPWGLRTGEAVKALAIASHVLRSGVLPSFRSYTLTKNSRSACVKRKPAETKKSAGHEEPLGKFVSPVCYLRPFGGRGAYRERAERT